MRRRGRPSLADDPAVRRAIREARAQGAGIGALCRRFGVSWTTLRRVLATAEPKPVQPKPVQPKPVQPKPVQPKHGYDNIEAFIAAHGVTRCPPAYCAAVEGAQRLGPVPVYRAGERCDWKAQRNSVFRNSRRRA